MSEFRLDQRKAPLHLRVGRRPFSFLGLLMVLLLFTPGAFANTYRYQALLPQVDSAGFYCIRLIPEISHVLRPDRADLRVQDAAGKPVAFLWRTRCGEHKREQQIQHVRIESIPNRTNDDDWYRITFPGNAAVDKLFLETEGPRFYNRKARLLTPNQVPQSKRRNKRKRYRNRAFRSFRLTSDKQTTLTFQDRSMKELLLAVQRGDNESIKITEVLAWQRSRYVLAYLEPENRYHLAFGKDRDHHPHYDLGYFKNQIPEELPSLDPNFAAVKTLRVSSAQSRWLPLWGIWLLLGGVVIGLALLTVRMIRNLDKSGPSEAKSNP